jgi:hypothetical protein
VQASHPVELVRAQLLHCSVWPTKPDVMTLSSSDTEEALELLSQSPTHVPPSRPSDPCSSSGSDLFEDWPEANDTVVSVYVALTVDASISHASTATALPDGQGSRAGSTSTRPSRSWAAPSRRSRG